MNNKNIVNHIKAAICEVTQDETNELTIDSNTTFIEELNFDSLRIATLSVCLESELDTPILLDEWIGSVADPSELTVGSLYQYIESVITPIQPSHLKEIA